ncbi:hypothetical protein LSUE1_G001395 [Lachnellula suecica]|uniref:Uncharacterized protein n=1 Tax=Lachnellula suecica TaxID=602035 RepID=A0A8T9C9N9_9HELO|nr:hypothetical protein LSUE1_G001395 [Lachnellula suecica]
MLHIIPCSDLNGGSSHDVEYLARNAGRTRQDASLTSLKPFTTSSFPSQIRASPSTRIARGLFNTLRTLSPHVDYSALTYKRTASAVEAPIEAPAAKRRETLPAADVAETPKGESNLQTPPPQRVYAVILKTLARTCIPYCYTDEETEDVLELYAGLDDANNRVLKEWEESDIRDIYHWEVQNSFEAGREMWQAVDMYGEGAGVQVYVKEWEVKRPGSEPKREWKGPAPGGERYGRFR